MADKPFVHPYIPNSVPETKQAMLDELGLSSVEEIYAEIPDRLRFKGTLDIPPAILSERAAAQARAGPARHEHLVRRLPELLRRRLLAAPRAVGRRRDHQPRRVRQRLLRRRLQRPRQVPHPVRVQQHARRAARLRRRRQPHLRLGRRGRALVPHGPAHHRPRQGARPGAHEPHAAHGGAHALPAGGDGQQHQDPLLRVGPRDRHGRPRGPQGQAGRLLRRRVLGEPHVPRHHRGQRREDRGARPLGRRAGHRRRRPHHARRAGAARRDRRRHRLRRHPAAGHAHARRRRLLRVHRLQGRRPGVRAGVPAGALHRHGDGHARPVLRGRGAPRPHQLRRPRPGQGLGRHGVGPVDHSRRRLHGADGPAGLQGDRRDLHRPLALRGQEARRAAGRPGQALAELLQRVRRRLQRHRQDAWPRSTRPCSASRSSAARTSPPSSPSSARARSTASPSTTTRPTSTSWSRPSRR